MISPGLSGSSEAGRHPVGDEAPHLGGDAGRRAVGQVAAVVEAHGQDGVARLQQGLVDGQVGVGPGVGLDVGVLGPEQGAEAVAGQVLHLVDDLVPAVVAPARVPLGVLVGEDRARGGQHRRRGEVLRGDELQGGRLALGLLAQQAGDLGVAGQPLVEGRGGERGGHGSARSSLGCRVGPRRGRRAGRSGAGGGRPRTRRRRRRRRRRVASARPDGPAPQADHVGVVVPTGQGGGGDVVDDGGPDPGHLVGGHGDADARAAHADPPLDPPSATARPTAAPKTG